MTGLLRSIGIGDRRSLSLRSTARRHVLAKVGLRDRVQAVISPASAICCPWRSPAARWKAYAPPGAGCAAPGSYTPELSSGLEVSVWVTVTVRVPLLPEFVDADTATGQFVVQRDRYVGG